MNKFKQLVQIAKQNHFKKNIFSILQEKKNQRSKADLALLENALIHITFIRGLKQRLNTFGLQEALKLLDFKYAKKGEYLYQQGDREENLYIILEGKVEISIDKKNIQTKVKIVEKGKTFGDLALTEYREIRKYSAIAQEDSFLATMDKNSFLTIVKMIQTTIADQAENLQKNNLFSTGWSRYDLMRIAINFEIKKYRYRDVIYEEGDLGDEIYFVMNGSVENFKKSNLTISNKPNEFETIDMEEKNFKRILTSHLSIFGQSSLFGFEDFLNSGHLGSWPEQIVPVRRMTSIVVKSARAEIWCMEIEVEVIN